MVDINKYIEMGKAAGAKAGKGLFRALPYVDAVYYTGQGINDFRTGHPWRGAGQLGLAGLDATLDTASLLAGPEGLLLKQGAKKVAKKGIEKTLQNIAKKNTVRSMVARPIASVGLQLGINDNKQNSQEQLPQPQSNTQQQNNVRKTSGGIVKPSGYVNGNTNIATPEEVMNILSGGAPNTLENIPNQQNEQPQTNNDILNRLSEYYEQQKEHRKPYLEGLQSYVDNYNGLNRRAFNMDRYLAGIAGWSGNDNFARMIGRYNPATVEATRLDLLNKLAEEQANELNIGNEVIGNAAVLQQAGLPLEAVFANPNLIKNASSIMNARTNAEARRYVADQTYKARVYDTFLDNKIKQEINNGRMANARQLAQLRENNRYNIAVLQAQAYGNLGNRLQNLDL